MSFRIKCFLFGIPLGNKLFVTGKFHILRFPGSTISIGSGFRAVSDPYRYPLSVFSWNKIRTLQKNSKIIVGNNVTMNCSTIICRNGSVLIGDGSIIAGNCQITNSDGHSHWPPEDRRKNLGIELDKDVVIGKNVWIGINCIILKGVVIDDNCIVGAGSVVTKSIPPNCMAAGNPAQVLKVFK